MQVGDEYLNETSDPCFALEQWVYYLLFLWCEYGPDVLLLTDGGYNNVQLVLRELNP